MARPPEIGLKYFSFDTDFSDHPKVKMLIAEFGAKGYIVAIELLCSIYRHRGYYFKWDEMNKLLFANSVAWCGASVNLVEAVVKFLIKWEFFNKDLFNSDKILTNSRCQKNYLSGTRKRTNSEIEPHFNLIFENNPVSSANLPPETQKKAVVIPQSKLKESKANKKKEKESNTLPLDSCFNSCLSDNEWLFLFGDGVQEKLKEFLLKLKKQNVKEKTLEDFQSHFANWHELQMKNKKSIVSQENFPNKYDSSFERKLQGNDLMKYYQHLKSIGWNRSTGPGGTMWNPPSKN